MSERPMNKKRLLRLTLVSWGYGVCVGSIFWLLYHEPIPTGILVLVAINILIDATKRGPL